MNLKMPKPAYRIILAVFLLSFVVASCNNKKKDKEKETKDTIQVKPVDPGTNNPSTPDTLKTDTISKKPVDPGT